MMFTHTRNYGHLALGVAATTLVSFSRYTKNCHTPLQLAAGVVLGGVCGVCAAAAYALVIA